MYEILAKYYDQLVYDPQAIDDYVQFVCQFLKREFKNGIDYGCGSGDITIGLSHFYPMVGVDLSGYMLEQLRLKDDTILTIEGDMQDVKLAQTFDFALCLCDSFNYLLTSESVTKFFHNVFAHLNPGGIFIMDSHHLNRLDEFKEDWIEEGSLDDCDYQWAIHSEDNRVDQHFAFYRKDGLIQEYHQQIVYDPDWIKAQLSHAGFKNIQIYYDMDSFDNENREKYFFIGEK